MSAVRERDYTVIMNKIYEMIRGVIEETIEWVVFSYEKKIANKQKELTDLKWEYPIKYKNAASEEAITKLRKDITDIEDEINNYKFIINQIQLAFLYAQQGVQSIFNVYMMSYGVAAADTPSISLKGSGDIVLKADKANNIYVSNNKKVGSPTGAIYETLDTLAFVAKVPTFVSKTVRGIMELHSDRMDLIDKEDEYKQK